MAEVTGRCASCGAETALAPHSDCCSACAASGRSGANASVSHAPIGTDSPVRGSVALRVWASVFLLALAAYGGLTLWRMYDASRRPYVNQPVYVEETGFQVADFTLTERSGRPFHSQELAGQIWVASFFYAGCPGQCVMLNQAIADQLGGDLAKEPTPTQPVKFVSISVDPQNDTPERLSEYADRYLQSRKIDAGRWLFLTDPRGSREVIGAVSQASFKVPFSMLDHSSKLILVDQQGMVRGYYAATNPEDLKRLRKQIRELHEKPPTADSATTGSAKSDEKSPPRSRQSSPGAAGKEAE